MSRRPVVEVQCGRCDRVEYVPPPKKGKLEDDAAKVEVSARFSLDGDGLNEIKFKYSDLCSPCQKTVRSLIESIKREIKGKSPSRKARAKEGGDDATPSIEVAEATQPSASSSP